MIFGNVYEITFRTCNRAAYIQEGTDALKVFAATINDATDKANLSGAGLILKVELVLENVQG